ncbi:MAG: amidohydrolase, partial [Thermomicrobium sp.]|nr:amidohydrolase [Thermomicrobium sp.]
MRLALINIGCLFTGDINNPLLPDCDTVIVEDGTITQIGKFSDLAAEVEQASTVVDVNGMTVAPGLIDSHCHVVLGDYTP